MEKFYITNYLNLRMENFMLRNGDVKKDSKGIYTSDPEDFDLLQRQFDLLEYFKSINNFVNSFDLEYMLTKDNFTYYARVVEDDFENVFTLVYESQDTTNDVTIDDVVEIRNGDIFCD
jgi:hypothetical protein|nr:MAG TPA: hypothetical protein [Caudoviricetes sp.]